MANTKTVIEFDLSSDANELLVDIVEFPHEMTPPTFGNVENTDAVKFLNLRDIIEYGQETLILKGEFDDAVCVVGSSEMVDQGVVDMATSNLDMDLQGYHYYAFADELTLYSEYAINILT